MAREMKDSGVKWIGEIPREWGLSKIKYEITGYKAGPFGSSLITDKLDHEGEIVVYTPEHVALMSDSCDNDLFLPKERRYKMSQFIVKEGDIIFPIVGSLGRAMRISSKMKNGIINQRLAKFRLKSEKVFEEYFMWLFSRSSFYKTYIDVFQRGTIIVNLTKSIVNEMPLPLPPISEQKAIADFLDEKCGEIDGLLEDLAAEVKTLTEYKKSIIAETVTHGLNPNAPMKDSGIPWAETIPAHWMSDKFKNKLMVRRVTGQGEKQVLSVYREFGVVPKDSRDDNHNITSEDTSKYKYVRPNDFVINKMKAWQGSMGVSDYEGIVSPAYFVYGFSDNDYNPRFFHYFMRNANNIPEYRRLSGGIREGQWDLSPYDLGNMPVIVPPKTEQNEIVAFLDEKCALLDQSIADKNTQIETLKAYKSSLIYEYVTGKKQVI